MTKIVLPFRLPGLNEYTAACRGNRFAGANMKHKAQDQIARHLGGVEPITKPVIVCIEWMEKTARRDIDNLSFAKKFILDALVAEEILPDDSRKWVKGFRETFPVGDEDRITITLEEETEE